MLHTFILLKSKAAVLALVRFVELILMFLQEVLIVHLLADRALDDVPSAVPEMRC